MGLSSNILWHQTSFNVLKKILREKQLKYAYSLESTFSIVNTTSVAFPMISLCDLPLSELGSYLGKYGDYSIGFSKEWGERNKACPVWYCYDKGDVIEFISRYNKAAATSQNPEAIDFIIQLLAYMKPVQGALPKKNYKSYRFYDETEVRFVPENTDIKENGRAPMLSSSDYDKYKQGHSGNSVLNFGVDFEWNDIKYIVVKEEQQIMRIKMLLDTLNCDNGNIIIFCSSQIREDVIGIEHNVPIDKPNQDEIDLGDMQLKATRAIISGSTSPDYWDVLLSGLEKK